VKWTPRDYQSRMVDRVIEQDHIGLFLDMGLGKSVITLTAVKRLKHELGVVRRVLVIAPLRVAETVWTAEAGKWDHLRDMRLSRVIGDPARRLRALKQDADVYVINRENVVWLVDLCARRWPFDCVVIDELSSFKSAASMRFRALRKVIGRAARVIGLTGTPSPNGVMDLWSQIYLLDQGERLYRTLTQYRTRWFDYNPYRHEYKPKDGAAQDIQSRLEGLCVSMRAADYLTLPELVIDDIPVAMPKPARRLYDELKREYVLLMQSGNITAVNAAALCGKLLQMCNGSVYRDDGNVEVIHTAKLDALAETIEQLGGESALVFYEFRHDVPGIVAALAKAGVRGRMSDSAEAIEDWSRGKVKALIAHPASAGYGLNLQDGGRHVIFFGLPWSLELYQQSIARLHRQGQARGVIVHRLIVSGSMDERVKAVLDDKGEGQAALLEALKAELG
jgi:SNF2 family DNA or RNA helicase